MLIWSLVCEEQERISLIILDLIMPRIAREDRLKGLLKINLKAKVIVASGYASDISVKECMQLGAKSFVAKPFRFNDLLQQARKTLDEK